MRIAYICADPGIPVFGQKGCSIHVQEVIRALRHRGATVDLFASRVGDAPPSDLADLTVQTLPPIPRGDQALREKTALSINATIWTELERMGPYDLIYERYSLWSYSAMEFAQSRGIPSVLEVNAPLIEEQAQHRQLVYRNKAKQVATRAFRAAHRLVAVSDEVKDYLARWGVAAKVQVIPNGVNHHRFSANLEPALPKSSNTFTVGFVGSLKPWHGLPHLVAAFTQLYQRVPQARLLIIGDGPQRESLTTELEQRGLRAVTTFTGAIAPDQVPGFLAAMDVAVAPYPARSDFYFSPLKVVEYMAAGLPVVVSRIGQLTALVADERTGLLCPPGDEAALATALERLWQSPSLRQQLGQAARAYILTHHTWDAIAEQVLAIAQTPITA